MAAGWMIVNTQNKSLTADLSDEEEEEDLNDH
jgi:hypothetical protein